MGKLHLDKMIQSVHIGIALAIFGLSITLAQIRPGQLDHFLPPPPSRLNPISEGQRQVQPRQRRPPLTPVTDLLSRNPYLSRAYGGTWFRTNFQDLFSYRGAQKLEWFEVLDGNDCKKVPATVNAGRPPRDICLEAAVDERRCICINTGRSSSETGYEQICGNCRDPCQLKFTPDRVPRYLQRLAVQDKADNVENDDYDY